MVAPMAKSSRAVGIKSQENLRSLRGLFDVNTGAVAGMPRDDHLGAGCGVVRRGSLL